MKSEHGRPEAPIETLDDDEIGALVRAVADDWQMPPQRLDRPTWRELTVRGGRRRRGRLARAVGPAVAAVLATVAVAFVAVWLTSPRPFVAVGSAPPAAGSATPVASAPMGSPASPLPALLRNGDLPAPSRVLVRLDGRYRIADLGAGTLSPISIAPFTGPTSVLARPGGGWVCICADWIERGSAAPSGVKVSLDVVDPSGVQTGTYPIRTLEGSTDPKWAGTYQMEIADVGSATWADGRTALVGWSVKLGARGWTSGIDIVDTETGAVVRTVELPTRDPAAAADWPLTRVAPRIMTSPAGDRVLISSFWYVEDPTKAIPPSGTDHWTATIAGGTLGALSPADGPAADRCGDFTSGLVDGSTWYAVCPTSGGLVIGRTRLDGQSVDRTQVDARLGSVDFGSAVARSGDGLFIWDPLTTSLTRFDLQTATIVKASIPDTVGSASPLDELAALGRRVGTWIAPSALGKVFLEPFIVVSADGSRVYALGIDPPGGGEGGGSKGVFAFDAKSLASIGHWPATADYISLAVSADGRFVYASGDGGRDAAGNPSPNGASITVFDAADGSVRLLAGQLGPGELWFPGPIVQ